MVQNQENARLYNELVNNSMAGLDEGPAEDALQYFEDGIHIVEQPDRCEFVENTSQRSFAVA